MLILPLLSYCIVTGTVPSYCDIIRTPLSQDNSGAGSLSFLQENEREAKKAIEKKRVFISVPLVILKNTYGRRPHR
ncbi:MAG: hypothetical protein ABS46_10780 [Cytophagaceae bacterium SCN 52-12]|nr:MAG: hypothetical protein ABS46_10780 [Cytophagaceae bacterium SCN 52-12]